MHSIETIISLIESDAIKHGSHQEIVSTNGYLDGIEKEREAITSEIWAAWREFAISNIGSHPDRLYLDFKRVFKLRHQDLFTFSGQPEIFGMKIYQVNIDEDHLYICKSNDRK